ncbi:hypothetical protein BJF92_00155 [Rhizobium rhizosphaerae]|uniref:Uncharacterized protein n=1 Tax=Xaviernesmea rhizosphaerae TaxID=1672749 RepID=A0A1Q9AE48_9HYPH|nr:hypothetical protein [Xaviernesmea rhizosphaerae]OLP53225.1 hypothetical protein BJF92_00155 [Xaviernesmea rhizosphaerae]
MKTLLSLCMPSNRSFARSYGSIETALIFAEKTGCRLIVSDNSRDAQKSAYWIGRSENLLYLADAPLDANQNLLNGMRRADTPFLLMLGDDDEIFLRDDLSPISLEGLPADIVGVRPELLLWTSAGGVRHSETFEILAQDPEARFAEYNAKAMANNSLYYSLWRREAFCAIIEAIQTHPTKGGYIDWAIVFALVSIGRVVHDPSILLRYDWDRWSTDEGIDAANTSLYSGASLKNIDTAISVLLRFLDIHCFLQLIALPMSPDEREAASRANSKLHFCAFAMLLQSHEGLMAHPLAPVILAVAHVPEPEVTFDVACDLLDNWDLGKPGLGTLYRDYLEAMRAA